MPWSKENPPEAVKFFKPSIQKHAIRIANAILEKTNNESLAIATGIKKAKELHIKSFKKSTK
jgi:uncharacterized protein YdaT